MTNKCAGKRVDGWSWKRCDAYLADFLAGLAATHCSQPGGCPAFEAELRLCGLPSHAERHFPKAKK